MSFGEASTYASIQHRNLSSKDKIKWEERAKADKKRYDTEMSKLAKAKGMSVSELKDAITEMAKKKKRGLDTPGNKQIQKDDFLYEKKSNEAKRRKKEKHIDASNKTTSCNEESIPKSLREAEYKTTKKGKKVQKIVPEMAERRKQIITLPTMTEALTREHGLIEILREDKFDRLNLIHGPDIMIALKVITSLCYGPLPDAVHDESKSSFLSYCLFSRLSTTIENGKYCVYPINCQLDLMHQNLLQR